MTGVEETNNRARLGRILGLIGWFWGALFFAAGFVNAGGTPLGDILAFFGGSLWIPAALIFIGRGLRKRAEAEDEEFTAEDEESTMPTPPIFPGRESQPEPPPPPPRMEPKPRARPETAAEPGYELNPKYEPKPKVERRPKPEPEPSPIPTKPREFEPTYKAKSSAEMIAEAKKRLSNGDS